MSRQRRTATPESSALAQLARSSRTACRGLAGPVPPVRIPRLSGITQLPRRMPVASSTRFARRGLPGPADGGPSRFSPGGCPHPHVGPHRRWTAVGTGRTPWCIPTSIGSRRLPDCLRPVSRAAAIRHSRHGVLTQGARVARPQLITAPTVGAGIVSPTACPPSANRSHVPRQPSTH
jgi:hypothetical protein